MLISGRAPVSNPVVAAGIAQRVRVVMVETTHPGNIGAVARAMKNMALERLYLVKPLLFPSPEADARASGAADLLERAVVCDSLAAAVADCHRVYGATARPRHLATTLITPRQMVAQIAAQPLAEVALVVGRESCGLTNEELQLCQALVHIPANPDFSSLNVAAAVQILAYELYAADYRLSERATALDSPLATSEEIERLYPPLELALQQIGFLDPANPRQLMARLRRLFARVDLERVELNILRGIVNAVLRHSAD